MLNRYALTVVDPMKVGILVHAGASSLCPGVPCDRTSWSEIDYQLCGVHLNRRWGVTLDVERQECELTNSFGWARSGVGTASQPTRCR
jgi:hypothetical protein